MNIVSCLRLCTALILSVVFGSAAFAQTYLNYTLEENLAGSVSYCEDPVFADRVHCVKYAEPVSVALVLEHAQAEYPQLDMTTLSRYNYFQPGTERFTPQTILPAGSWIIVHDSIRPLPVEYERQTWPGDSFRLVSGTYCSSHMALMLRQVDCLTVPETMTVRQLLGKLPHNPQFTYDRLVRYNYIPPGADYFSLDAVLPAGTKLVYRDQRDQRYALPDGLNMQSIMDQWPFYAAFYYCNQPHIFGDRFTCVTYDEPVSIEQVIVDQPGLTREKLAVMNQIHVNNAVLAYDARLVANTPIIVQDKGPDVQTADASN